MIEWSDEYLIGHPKIDSQHKILLDLIMELEKASLEGASKDVLQDILQEIVLFAKFHFRSEENIMARMGYPELEAHRKLHFELMDIFNTKIVKQGLGQSDPLEAQNFIFDWFLKHSSMEDAKIIAFQKASRPG
jgi:hemerythrin